MAYLKSTVASATYIQPIRSTPTPTITYTAGSARPIVADGVLIAPLQITNPGVFTAGTASEGTLSNPNNDSSL